MAARRCAAAPQRQGVRPTWELMVVTVERGQRVSYRRRFALWRAHEGRCAYCKEPVRFSETVVDHILPQRLGCDLDDLQVLRLEYNLPRNFSLDDPTNLLPVHHACNLEKGGKVFQPAALHFYLGIARAKAQSVQVEEERLTLSLRADRLLGSLEVAVEEGRVSAEAIQAILSRKSSAERHIYDPVVITFGLAVPELLDRGELPEDAPLDYPHLCDWLEEDLMNRLRRAFDCPMYLPEASARNGETVSVRVALIQPDLEQLEAVEDSWWEILEIAHFLDIYGEPADVTN